MTNDELLKLIENPPDEAVGMTVTGEGATLNIGEVKHPITDRQAEILFDHGGLMLMQRIKLVRKAQAEA